MGVQGFQGWFERRNHKRFSNIRPPAQARGTGRTDARRERQQPREENRGVGMTSRGLTSSARRLATLRGGSKRGVVSRYFPASSTVTTQLLLRSKQPVAVFSRSSSTRPRPGSGSELATAGGSNAPATADQDHLALAKPLDFDMASKIDGQESQMVTFELKPGQVIRVSQRRGLGYGTGARSSAGMPLPCAWSPISELSRAFFRRVVQSARL